MLPGRSRPGPGWLRLMHAPRPHQCHRSCSRCPAPGCLPHAPLQRTAASAHQVLSSTMPCTLGCKVAPCCLSCASDINEQTLSSPAEGGCACIGGAHDCLASRTPIVSPLRRSARQHCWRASFPGRAVKCHCRQITLSKVFAFSVKRLSMSYQALKRVWQRGGAITVAMFQYKRL